MLNTTNQSIKLPDALIEKCFGQLLLFNEGADGRVSTYINI
jgi:hypothetical protein